MSIDKMVNWRTGMAFDERRLERSEQIPRA